MEVSDDLLLVSLTPWLPSDWPLMDMVSVTNMGYLIKK